MKKKIKKYIYLFVVLFAISCSTKKDAFLNRSFHSVNTKFNVLYNGDVAFQKGLKELNSKYKDDYWKRLPIEPLKVEELAIPGIKGTNDNSNESFEKAEEKAVKAVQKHSMQIAGKERNNQIDEAYLLLGKSRYYSQRFVPALEAFNYVLQKYPTADLIHETRIWKAKTQLRLNNEEQALQLLQFMLKKEELLEEDILEKAHTAIAMVYTEMDSTDQVVHHLKRATITDNDKEQRARNLFILGQVYRERNDIDSSQTAFQQVIEMKKIPYKYRIHSQIEKAKNLSDSTDTNALIETLDKLIKDRDNRPYLDELHYQTGLVHQKLGRIDVSEEHFVKSVHTKNAKPFQQGLSYEELGNIYFDKAKFVDAGAYYDSVLSIPVANKNTKRLRRLKRKRENLEEVISFEEITQKTDSILDIVAMSKEEQTAFFQAHIDKLKEAEEKAKQETLNAGFGSFDDARNQASGNGKWYFYNTQVVGFGAQEFQRVWGNRPLEDNWRLSDKSVFRNEEVEESTEIVADEIEDSKKYDIASYLERIPTENSAIDSIKSVRNDAYYNLGLIYKEQFKVYELATDKFEKLLTFSPEERLILPTKYHLYKAYLAINSPKASNYKKEITTNYADSKYAKLILNPQSILEDVDDENSPENVYKKMFYEYEEKKYDEVIIKTETAIKQYTDLPILPKFELLRAYAIGKKDGIEAFRTALEFVKLNYSNTEEGKKAAQVIETISAQ
ncbi:MAG: tetratricopeptide repeat protein [Flavobacteriaceae bacterium]|nr:tetratricopeptide repeat protein [Flavobacteriaceae bacterium]